MDTSTKLAPSIPTLHGISQVVDGYELLWPIRCGGFGEVYVANNLSSDSLCALKIVFPENHAFELEAINLYKNTVRIRDYEHCQRHRLFPGLASPSPVTLTLSPAGFCLVATISRA